MSERTLFLAWQDKRTRQWFPIGRLDGDVERSTYRFRYTGGAERARQKVGFPWLMEFPEPGWDYRMIGWAPRYLARDLAAAEGRYEARVVRVNHQPIPLRQSFLIEMRGRWENHEPMSGHDYIPLIDLGLEGDIGPAPKLVLSD